MNHHMSRVGGEGIPFLLLHWLAGSRANEIGDRHGHRRILPMVLSLSFRESRISFTKLGRSETYLVQRTCNDNLRNDQAQ